MSTPALRLRGSRVMSGSPSVELEATIAFSTDLALAHSSAVTPSVASGQWPVDRPRPPGPSGIIVMLGTSSRRRDVRMLDSAGW